MIFMGKINKAITSLFFVILLASASFAAEPRYAEGEAIIMMRSGITQSSYAAKTAASASSMKTAAASAASSAEAYVVQVFSPIKTDSAAASSAASVKSAKNASSSEILTVAHIRTAKGESTEQLIARLKKNPDIIAAEPNRITYLSAVRKVSSRLADVEIDRRWGHKKIHVPEVRKMNEGKTLNKTIAAVMDTGVIYDHSDLKDSMIVLSTDIFKSLGYENPASFDGSCGIWFHSVERSSSLVTPVPIGGKGFTASGGTSDDIDNGTFEEMRVIGDIDGHGTHVAGIVGAAGDYDNRDKAAGVSNNTAILLALNIFSKIRNGSEYSIGSYDADTFRAIDFLIAAKNAGLNVKTVNMSFGSWRSMSKIYTSKIKSLSDCGIIICIAAGNEAQDIDSPKGQYQGLQNLPAVLREDMTITIGATTIYQGEGPSYTEIPEDKDHDYSNYSSSGKWIDIFAPGSKIYSTCRKSWILNADNETYHSSGYTAIDGTSMAAPMVTGAASLLCSMYPTLGARDIKLALLEGADANIAKTNLSAYGRLDITGAVKALEPAISEFSEFTELSSEAILPIKATGKLPEGKKTLVTDTYVTQSGEYIVSPAKVRDFLPDAKNVHALPVFAASADSMEGKIAAISFAISGDKLGDGRLETLHIFKLKASSSSFDRAEYKYVPNNPDEYKDGCYTIHNADKSNFTGTGFLSNEDYIITLFIQDNGAYDCDSSDNYIIDPAVICSNPPAAPTPSGSGGGGCNAGFAAMALIALVPMVIRRKH